MKKKLMLMICLAGKLNAAQLSNTGPVIGAGTTATATHTVITTSNPDIIKTLTDTQFTIEDGSHPLPEKITIKTRNGSPLEMDAPGHSSPIHWDLTDADKNNTGILENQITVNSGQVTGHFTRTVPAIYITREWHDCIGLVPPRAFIRMAIASDVKWPESSQQGLGSDFWGELGSVSWKSYECPFHASDDLIDIQISGAENSAKNLYVRSDKGLFYNKKALEKTGYKPLVLFETSKEGTSSNKFAERFFYNWLDTHIIHQKTSGEMEEIIIHKAYVAHDDKEDKEDKEKFAGLDHSLQELIRYQYKNDAINAVSASSKAWQEPLWGFVDEKWSSKAQEAASNLGRFRSTYYIKVDAPKLLNRHLSWYERWIQRRGLQCNKAFCVGLTKKSDSK